MSRGGDQVIPRPPETQPGGPPPWSVLPADDRICSESAIRRALSDGHVGHAPPAPEPGERRAAVLIALHETPDDGIAVILTRRPWHLRTHAGEMAFPGGGYEAGDVDLTATALREAEEEIALDPDKVAIIGALGALTTVSSGALIQPYVGWIDGDIASLGLAADPGEVDVIRHVPLAELLDDDAWREEIWVRGGEAIDVTFFEIAGDTIWGATARMLRELLVAVLLN